MACTLTAVSRVNDVEKLNALLAELSKDEQEGIVDHGFGTEAQQGWGDAWDIPDDPPSPDPTAMKSKPAMSAASWLQTCLISISPLEEFLAVAKESKSVFLTKKWPTVTSMDDQPWYEITWHGNLAMDEPDDHITCIKCIPLASQQRSSEGRPDWTCVICGFHSGYIRIFMMNGTLLLAQFLHDGPVVNIKLKTKTAMSLKEFSEQVEELLILYPNALVTIDGFSLYQSLRACRNQLAKAQASLSVDVEPPPLAYRKWCMDDQEKIKDVGGCGITTPCLFDRLQTASFTTGFNATVRGSAPVFHHFFTAGSDPFIGVYQALEGSAPPIMSEVALAVASKLTSAVMSRLSAARGWWSGGATQEPQNISKEKKLPKVELGTNLGHRYCLQDKRRVCETIMLAPIGNLATVTDAFNRVMLFDYSKGIVVRMWKGYRDAQCGWIVVEEEDDEQPKQIKRKALFVVIYAPKRGIIEIYLTENGNRVGAFNVGKDCRLLHPGYQSLGQTVHNFKGNCNLHQCFLMYSDGTIKSIQVPFHCALSTTHSVHAKDQHLLKKIANIAEKKSKYPQDEDDASKSLIDILLDIQVPSTQKKAIQNILTTPGLSSCFLLECLRGFVMHLSGKASDSSNEDIEFQSERQDLIQYCRASQQLVEMFITIYTLNDAKEGPDSEMMFSGDANSEEDSVSELLHVDLHESEKILKNISRYRDVCVGNLYDVGAPKPLQPMDITLFIQCFQIEVDDNTENSSSSSSTKVSSIEVADSLTTPSAILLGSHLFENAILGLIPISKLTLALESSAVPPRQCMNLLTLYTQSKDCCNILSLPTLYQLHSLVASICSLKGGPEKDTAELPVGKTSVWWDSVRDVMSQSCEIGNGYLMSIVCRSVAIELNVAAYKINKHEETEIITGKWEPVLMDMEKWNFLVSQLENLIEIDCFVHSNHDVIALSGANSPSVMHHEHSPRGKFISSKQKQGTSYPQIKSVDRLPSLSIQGISTGGYGAFAEIVADVLVRQGVPGPCIGPLKPKPSVTARNSLIEDSMEESEADMPDESLDSEGGEDTGTEILPDLTEIRLILPFSLQHDVLWVHCAWESIMVWNEDVEDISMLSTALIHLACIHNAVLQQGLAVLMWKTVYKESIKALTSLVEKVGKAPKERLCKQTVHLGYKALEDFLATAKQLIEMLLDMDLSDSAKPEFKTEELWDRKGLGKRSIVEQAADEPLCNISLLKHYWCLVTTLYLVMNGAMKSIKPLTLFDTKGKHAFVQPLHANPLLSTELDYKIIKSREAFCCNSAAYTINNHVARTQDDDMLRHNTTDLLKHMNITLELAKAFNINEDVIRQFVACELYSAGLDIAAQEMAMMIQDKVTFTSKVLDVIGQRLAKTLLEGDVVKVSATLTKLPTRVTSWLESIDRTKLRVSSVPLTNTFLLLQYINTNFAQESKDLRFINELIESLKIFL